MNAVLVTGACINTGASIVEKFASEGIPVVFTGRNAEKVDAAGKVFREKFPGAEIFGFRLNALTDEGTVDEKAAEELFAELDRRNIFIETLVLNAADVAVGQKIFETPLSEFVRIIQTNLVWDYCLCEHAGKRMKEQGGGNIVFINSNTTYRAIPDRIAYIASKGGQLGLMRALAMDLGKYHIRVNAVLPGMIKTERWVTNPDFYRDIPSKYTPIGDVATGADIADAVWYFAMHAKNTTGAELVVDGGNSIQLYPIIPKSEML